MKAAMFREMTHVLGPPPGHEADVFGLPVMIDHEAHTITSCWVLEPEDVAALAAGGRVYLTVLSFVHPVVALAVRVEE